MIARVWRGRTPAARAEAYLGFLDETGLPPYRAVPGHRGVFVLRHLDGQTAEFVLLSLWDSREAVREFAGPDPERAVYYTGDEDFLLEQEPHVRHFEVLRRPGDGPRAPLDDPFAGFRRGFRSFPVRSALLSSLTQPAAGSRLAEQDGVGLVLALSGSSDQKR